MTKKLITPGDAIREGLAEAGKKDKNVLLFAEGIDDPSSVFGTTKDLKQVYGEDRIIEMPVSENGLCGVAIGAALMGKRPVISFHRVEFALLALEQIMNNAAKAHYISNGKHRVPLVIRAIIGRGWGQGPEHSQSLEILFASIPGLKVIMPTFPNDAKGMIIAAIEDNNPVIFLEHRWCHYVQGLVEDGYFVADITEPIKIRDGNKFTIVASSFMVLEALKAALHLANCNIEVEVFDLRVLRPLKLKKIFESVRKTGCLMTVDCGFKTLGIGAEIISQLVSAQFDSFKIPPIRLGMPDHPIPSSVGMLNGLYPDAIQIFEGVARALQCSSELISKELKALKIEKANLPMDIPNPEFKGPF